MLIWTARVSKKTKAVVAVILAGILAAAVLLLVGRSGGGQDAAAWQLTGNADRIAYLESMGWQVEEEPVETLGSFCCRRNWRSPTSPTTSCRIPRASTFLRAAASKWPGTPTPSPTIPDGRRVSRPNLYVCEGQPVAGDILCAGADGFQDTLVYPEQD